MEDFMCSIALLSSPDMNPAPVMWPGLSICSASFALVDRVRNSFAASPMCASVG